MPWIEATTSSSSSSTSTAKTVTPYVTPKTYLPSEESPAVDYYSQVTVGAITYTETPNAAGGLTVQIGMAEPLTVPRLIITSDVGSTVTVSGGGTTITPTSIASNMWQCDVPSNGTYTITSVLNEDSIQTTQIVSATEIYEVTLMHYNENITVTYPNGGRCTLTDGGTESYTATTNPYTFTVHQKDTNYTLTTAFDGAVKTQTVTSGSSSTTQTITVAFGTINVTIDSDFVGSTVTCTDGTTTITKVSSATTLTFSPPITGTWTVSLTHDSKTYSKQVVVSDLAVAVSVKLQAAAIYGAYWDGSSSTTWTRTDEAENFSNPNPYYVGMTGTPSSPFDDIMPWSGMTVTEDSNVGSLVAIPKFWYKITQNASTHDMKIQIANGEMEGFSVSPAHMDRGDGSGERDVVYVSRYHCATSTYKSTPNVVPQASVTRADFRTNIHNLGTNIWMMDFATRFTLWLLYIVEFANWDSQTCIGYGCGNNSSTQAMGYTDSMPYHTGTSQSSRTTYGLGTQYRNIEGLWDNVRDWIDGCYYDSNGLNIILNPANFSDSSGGTAVGIPSSGYPSQFTLEDVSGTFPLFIPTEANGSDSTYSCDYWGFDSSSPCLDVGGAYGQGLVYGLFFVSRNSTSSANAFVGSRFLKLP